MALPALTVGKKVVDQLDVGVSCSIEVEVDQRQLLVSAHGDLVMAKRLASKGDKNSLPRVPGAEMRIHDSALHFRVNLVGNHAGVRIFAKLVCIVDRVQSFAKEKITFLWLDLWRTGNEWIDFQRK